MKLNLLLVLCLMSSFVPAFAQFPNYQPPRATMPPYTTPTYFYYGATAPSLPRKSTGYLITTAHDTIRGVIICKSFAGLQSKVTLMDANKQKTIYVATQLAGMVINRKEALPIEFETKQIAGKTYCAHRLVKGYLKLYADYYYAAGGSQVPTYYVQKGAGPIELFGTFQAGLGSDNFRKTARAYFQDYADLAKRLDERTYKFADIEKVFEEYNIWHNNRPGEVDKKDSF